MSQNTTEVKFADGRRICLSYGVPVAVWVPRDYCPDCRPRHIMICGCPVARSGYLKTDRKYSVTTSRHANAFAGSDATVIPHDEFRRYVEPLEVK